MFRYILQENILGFSRRKKYHKNRYKMLAFVKTLQIFLYFLIETTIILGTDDKPVITHWPRTIRHIFLVSYIFAVISLA